MVANVNAAVKEITPESGADLAGYKLGWLVATAKAAQNDTITIKNTTAVAVAILQLDGAGTSEANTIATNVITLTTAVTTGDVKGLIIYR